jgi:hypothetical protein
MKSGIDMGKFERDLQKLSKQFGEDSSQAVTRWGVQVARELAKDTFARGKKKERGSEEKGVTPRKQQEGAMIKDGLNVLLVVDRASATRSGYKVTNQGKSYYVQARQFLTDTNQINTWISQNRAGRRKRTRKLAVQDKRVCTKANFNKAMRDRKRKAGIAKGSWINAGHDLIRAQRGEQRVTISASFLKYAKKAAGSSGSGKPAKPGYKPTATLSNPVPYSSDGEILPKRDAQNAIEWGLRKTLTWYRMAMRKSLSKK